jgi:peptidoglycan/xylan/chitin deacetylase (PgdA/CDA1 family)
VLLNISYSERLRRLLKLAVLYVFKMTGIFFICRRATRNGLRILCYHGTIDREEYVKPKLFMQARKFEQRMRFLRKKGFPIVPLDVAFGGLSSGTLPHHATVITIDDGSDGTYRYALPILKQLGIPATVYVTTSYLGTDIVNIETLMEYAMRGSAASTLRLPDLPETISGPWDLKNEQSLNQAVEALVGYSEPLEPAERAGMARTIVERLGLDWDDLEARKMFYMADAGQIRAFAAAGMDVQLHTHRHRRRYDDEATFTRDIADNRQALSALVPGPFDHFCYPYGSYASRQFPWLEAAEVKSATTCKSHFNYADTPRYELGRFLDGEDVSQIEFEAEMNGVLEVLRRLRIM